MTKQIDELLIQLADAIYADQHPETPVDPETGVKGPEYNAYNLGEYIYSVQVANSVKDIQFIEVFTMWPRLHHWIREKLDANVQLDYAISTLPSVKDQVLVKVTEPDSRIERKAFLTREVMLDMLKERGVPESKYSVDDPIDTLWYKVQAYECL